MGLYLKTKKRIKCEVCNTINNPKRLFCKNCGSLLHPEYKTKIIMRYLLNIVVNIEKYHNILQSVKDYEMYGIKIDLYLEFEDHIELISVISRTDDLLKYRPIFSTDDKKKVVNVLLVAINIESEKLVNILKFATVLRPATSLKTENFKVYKVTENLDIQEIEMK
jgi:hypothetical protein